MKLNRLHKLFIRYIDEFLLSQGAEKTIEEPFRYNEYNYKDVVYTVPYIQKYTHSVHIRFNGEPPENLEFVDPVTKEYNFHYSGMSFTVATELFKKHTELLWQ